jgi:hypothetical protein
MLTEQKKAFVILGRYARTLVLVYRHSSATYRSHLQRIFFDNLTLEDGIDSLSRKAE